MDAYCENGDCRVVLYTTDDEHKNCPGCGQFGRLKDKPSKEETHDYDRDERGYAEEE